MKSTNIGKQHSEVAALYRSLRGSVPPGQTIAVVHVGACETTLASGTGGEPDGTVALAIGARNTAQDHFKHRPPTPGELENAIMVVEDELARARATIADGAVLLSGDAALREVARLAGVTGVAGVADRAGLSVQIDAVEGVFDRLAAVSLGRPASSAGLPEDNEFAATLLILRELMHHLGFSALTVR